MCFRRALAHWSHEHKDSLLTKHTPISQSQSESRFHMHHPFPVNEHPSGKGHRHSQGSSLQLHLWGAQSPDFTIQIACTFHQPQYGSKEGMQGTTQSLLCEGNGRCWRNETTDYGKQHKSHRQLKEARRKQSELTRKWTRKWTKGW